MAERGVAVWNTIHQRRVTIDRRTERNSSAESVAGRSLLDGAVGDAIGHGTTMALAASGFGFTVAYVLLRPRLRGLSSVATAEPADFDVEVIEES